MEGESNAIYIPSSRCGTIVCFLGSDIGTQIWHPKIWLWDTFGGRPKNSSCGVWTSKLLGVV